MTLKERLYEERKHWHIKEELDKVRKNETEDDKIRHQFYQVCAYLNQTVDLSDVSLPDYKSVFQFIEKHNIDISNVIKPYEYDVFKSHVVSQKMVVLPCIGKRPEKMYNLDNRDDYIEYKNLMRAEAKERREEKKKA